MTVHVFIPDTQCAPGRPTDHLLWIGNYIVDTFAGRDDVRIVHAGDHYDFPALSSYETRGSVKMEGLRLSADIQAGHDGLASLTFPIRAHNELQRKNKKAQWTPDMHLTLGNHEHRLARAVNDHPQTMTFTMDDLKRQIESFGFKVHDFLTPVELDGVVYSHYFPNRGNGRPIGGTAINRLKQLGHSFTQGHQQTLEWGQMPVRGKLRMGLVAGAAYLHSEHYMNVDGNNHWRGIVVKHNVHDGEYDPEFISLDALCRTYEGVSLKHYLVETYGFDTRFEGA